MGPAIRGRLTSIKDQRIESLSGSARQSVSSKIGKMDDDDEPDENKERIELSYLKPLGAR
jgi:hypothetical protein